MVERAWVRRRGLSWLACGLLAVIAAVPGEVVAQPPATDAKLFDPLGLPGLSGASNEDPVSFSGEYKIVAGGRDGVLSVKASIKPSWHVYSTTQKAGGPIGSRLKVEPSNDFQMTRPFIADRLPHVEPPGDFPVPSEKFSEEVIWTAAFRVAESAPTDKLAFHVTYDGQACQDGGVCMPLSKVEVPVQFAGEMPAPTRGEFSNPRVHAKLRGEVTPRTVTPGSTIKLTVTAEPAPKYHVYALAERDPAKVAKPALIAWKEIQGWTASAPQPSEKPVEHETNNTDQPMEYYYEKPVTWTVELKVPDDAAPAGYVLRGLIGYQTCTNQNCDPPAGAEFSVTVAVVKQPDLVDPAPELLTFKTSSYNAAAKLAAEAVGRSSPAPLAQQPPPAPRAGATKEPSTLPSLANYSGPLLEVAKIRPSGGLDEKQAKQSVLVVLPTALLAGFILNFMPCVLPVIGLKIVSFVHQSGHSRSRIFILNLWYCLGLLAVFVVLATLAVFAGFSWGQQFQSAGFNIVLASIVFAFALSFLGIWEIPLPGIVGASGANKVAEQEGPAGAFLKGMLTTVLATPCSGPLLIPALAWALKQPPVLTYAVFICVGLGMAAPYLLVGAFPKLISFLPKPGDWMETFKHMMGFVLLGTVVYLLTFIRMPLVVPTVAFMMGLWAALWWIGRVPVWEELHKRIRAWAIGGAFATLIGMFAFNWLNEVMDSRFKRDVAAALGNPAFNPTARSSTGTSKASDSPELPWKPYSLELLSKLVLEEKKTVFVDFTADWCPNCKLNERVALNIMPTKSFVESNQIETIKADWTDGSPPISEMLKQLGGTAIPYYAVFTPEDPYHPVVMEGILTHSRLLEAFERASAKSPSLIASANSGEASEIRTK